MSRRTPIASTCLLLLVLPLGTKANADEWNWAVAPYLWAAGVSGDLRIGPISTDIDVSSRDLFNALDGAFMFKVRAEQTGTQAFYTDLIYLSVDPDVDDTPITGRVDASLDGLILETGYSRVFSEKGWSWVAGIRFYELDLEVEPTLLPTIDGDDFWADGFVGLEYQRSISSNWNLFVQTNIGAGGSDISYGLTAMALRELPNGHSIGIGYKALGFDNNFDNPVFNTFKADTLFQGLALTYVFK